MRVGIFHPTLDICGGAEVVAVVAANALARRGYETSVLVNRMINQKRIQEMVGEPLHSSIRIVTQSTFLQQRGIFHPYESGVRTLLFKLECDVLIDIYSCLVFPWTDVSYIHFPYLSQCGIGSKFPYVKRPRLRQVIAMSYGPFQRSLDCSNKLLLANSRFTANAIRESFGADSKVLYPPIPSTFYSHEQYSHEKEREDLVITTARFAQDKGVELVPTIASLTNPNIKFVMIGLAQDINVVKLVKQKIKKLGLQNRVNVITDASREEIKGYLGRAKIYLNTNKMEHFGMGIAEAMAMGCLPAVYDWGGAPEFVPDKYRYYIPSEAARIIEYAAEKWSEKESQSMQKIAERFSESNFARRFIELFSEYVNSRKERHEPRAN